MNNLTYTFKPYEDDDFEFIYYLKKISYEKYVEFYWKEWNEEFQKKLFIQFINNFSNDIKIIIVDNKSIGFYHGKQLDNINYEIGNICLLPEYQGKGIGTNIINNIINDNKNQIFTLKCFKHNPAIDLYKKLGFSIKEELDYHYLMVLDNYNK